jgi:hypothetical protein
MGKLQKNRESVDGQPDSISSSKDAGVPKETMTIGSAMPVYAHAIKRSETGILPASNGARAFGNKRGKS